MFGAPHAGQAPDMAEGELLRFRAGKMKLEGKMCIPDKRKGLIRLIRDLNDMLLHFQWLDRTNNPPTVEDDLIIFPGDATFVKVGKPDVRVYSVKLSAGGEHLFWMQEADAAGDAELARMVHNILNEADDDLDLEAASDPASSSQTDEAPLVAGTRPIADAFTPPAYKNQVAPDPTASAVGAGSVQQAGPMFVPVPAEPGSGAPALGGSGGAPTLDFDFVSLLKGMAASMKGSSQQQQHHHRHGGGAGPSLAEILTPDTILPLLQNPSIREQLAQYLPESNRSQEAITSLISSPQFQQQLHAFSQVLQQGRIDLTQFGIDPNKYGFSAVSFLQAIQDQAGSGQASGPATATQGQGQGPGQGASQGHAASGQGPTDMDTSGPEDASKADEGADKEMRAGKGPAGDEKPKDKE
eukprot:jgi/Mesvir1/20601/Mv14834-RA.1